MPDEPAEQRFSMRRDVHDDVTPVSLRAFPPKKPALFHAVHQLDGAVMLDLQPLGETADGRFLIVGQPAQCQQTHVLLRLEPNRPGGLFALLMYRRMRKRNWARARYSAVPAERVIHTIISYSAFYIV